MPTPQGIFVTKSKDTLRLEYAEEKQHKLRAEYLRAVSYTHLTLPTSDLV